jgi:hypothetical protein
MSTTITITPQGIVLAGSVISALTIIIVLLFKFVRWVDRQKQQDTDLKGLKEQHEADMKDLNDRHDKDIEIIQREQELAIYGILAALKGLSEKGCNGPVTEAIGRIEDYLNRKAHGNS